MPIRVHKGYRHKRGESSETKVVINRPFIKNLLHNHYLSLHNINFLKKKSGEAKDSVIFCFFILLHKRAKPIQPPYIHPSAHLSTHTSTPLPYATPRVEDSIKPLDFRRRILLPCFANAKPLPEAGNNNYLGSECDHLPEEGNIYISIHSSAHHPPIHCGRRRRRRTSPN
jgi:hypothetical protein